MLSKRRAHLTHSVCRLAFIQQGYVGNDETDIAVDSSSRLRGVCVGDRFCVVFLIS